MNLKDVSFAGQFEEDAAECVSNAKQSVTESVQDFWLDEAARRLSAANTVQESKS